MVDLNDQSYEDLVLEVQNESQDKLQQLEQSQKKSWFKDYIPSAGKGIGKGTLNFAADAVTTMSDLAIYAGIGTEDLLDNVADDIPEAEKDAALNNKMAGLQKYRDGIINHVKQNESDDAVQNFFMNATSSVLKYGTVFSALGKAGMKNVVKKGGIAGFAEGFTDDVKQDLLGFDKALRLAVEQVSPNSLEYFDQAMDLNTDPSVAQQLLKRVMSGVEMSAIGAAGEKAVQFATPFVGAGIDAAKKSLPEGFKRAGVDAYGKVLAQWRKTKEWMNTPELLQNKTLAAHIEQKGEATFKFNQMEFDLDSSLKENLQKSVVGTFDSTDYVSDATKYSSKLSDYEAKLEALAPQIQDRVVNLAKAKGISESEALAKFAGEVSIDETGKLTTEGLKNVLRGQAHNIMLEQEATRFGMAIANKKNGIIQEKDFLESAKSFNTVVQQRMSLLTGAGRVLRGAQEIPEKLQKIQQEIVASGRNIEDVLDGYGKTINDPEGLSAMAKAMEDVFTSHKLYGNNADELMDAMTKAVGQIDPMASPKITGDMIGRKAASIYQANLLSSGFTIAQNTFGAMTAMLSSGFETTIQAVLGKAGYKSSVAPSMKEAMIQISGTFTGHLDAIRLAARASKNIPKNGISTSVDTFNHKMMDIPEMTASERDYMFQMQKNDLAPDNPLDANIAKSSAASILTGQPIWAIIRTQDTVSKSVAARNFMRGRYETMVYRDDVLGLGEGLLNDKQARKVLDQMFFSGRDEFSPAELQSLGIGVENAIEISQRLKTWRQQTSTGAVNYAASVVYQQPLGPGLQKFQSLLQDSVYGLGRFQVPFFTTPANVINESLKRMPLVQLGDESAIGLPLHLGFYRDFMAGGAKQAEAVARVVSGNAMSQFGYSLAESGYIQHNPKDVGMRQAYDTLLNIPSGSLKIGDKAIPLAMFGHVGIIISHGASLYHNENYIRKLQHASEQQENKFFDGMKYNLFSLMQVARDAPYAQAFDSLASVFDTDWEAEKSWSRLGESLSRMAGNLVPYSALQRQISNNLTEQRTRANGYTEQFFSSFAPYMNHTAYNAFGETYGVNEGITVRTRKFISDEVLSVLMEKALFHPEPAKFEQTVYGRDGNPSVKITLNTEQWERYHEIIRDQENIRGQYGRFISSDRFKGIAELSPLEQGKLLEQNKKEAQAILSKTRKRALDKVIYEYPDLQDTIAQEQKRALIEVGASSIRPAGQQTPTFQGGQ